MNISPVKFAALIAYIAREWEISMSLNQMGEIKEKVEDIVSDNIGPANLEHGSLTRAEVEANVVEMIRGILGTGTASKINAIRAHRQLTGWGLKESKEAVEAVIERIESRES